MPINYIADSTFRPYSFQERLTPFLLYKDAYEKTEAAYDDLINNADKFAYLSKAYDPESKAAKIYAGYADELKAQADDLARNGLNVNNRRALVNLKRRYAGEIGMLEKAETRRLEEQKRRDDARAKGISMLYANDNPTIEDYLYENTPNLYGIDTEDLRKEGAQYAQAASSRIYGNTQISDVNNYFQEIAQTQGYSPELMNAWRYNLESIPEFNQAVDDIMQSRGVNDNLTGSNYERARQSVINGIMEGAVYQEKKSVQQNPGKLTAAQAAADARQREQMKLSALREGYKLENGEWTFDPQLLEERYTALGLNSDNYEINPLTGKPKKKAAVVKTPEEKEEEANNKKGATALLALNKTPEVFKNNEGFEVTVNNEKRHYKYIGATSKHGDTWQHGAIGEDVPSRGWAITSSSNVMSPWGNFSGADIDSDELDEVKILADNEFEALKVNNPEVVEAINAEVQRYLEEEGLDENYPIDLQVVQVPNEGGIGQNGYLIAIREV